MYLPSPYVHLQSPVSTCSRVCLYLQSPLRLPVVPTLCFRKETCCWKWTIAACTDNPFEAVISCVCLQFLKWLPAVPLWLPAIPLLPACSPLFLFQKGDLLLKVNESSLDGLTHSQAVATLKATINLSSVVLVALEVIKYICRLKIHNCSNKFGTDFYLFFYLLFKIIICVTMKWLLYEKIALKCLSTSRFAFYNNVATGLATYVVLYTVFCSKYGMVFLLLMLSIWMLISRLIACIYCTVLSMWWRKSCFVWKAENLGSLVGQVSPTPLLFIGLNSQNPNYMKDQWMMNM